jgi:hypothetical protein
MCQGAEMTSQPKPDVDGRDEPARVATARQRDSDTLAKSYRYLRLALVGLLACLAVAVVLQSVNQGHLLGSVSAYYYTPAQAIFVGGLIGFGACMIALQGTTLVEDIFLNLGGAFAALVAIVPTARDGDYRALVRACREAGTPLLTQKASSGRVDCPTVQALEAATRANVDNNLWAFLVVGAAGLVVAVVFAGRDGTLRGQADGDALRSFWWGFGAVLGLWLAVLIARLVSLQWVIDNGHWIAAVLLFVCVLVVAWQNSRRVKEEQSGDGPRKGRSGVVERSMGAVGALGRRDWYIWARWTLLVAVVTGVLWGVFHLITLFWFEAAVFVFFLVFWTVQTIELDPSTKPASGRRTAPPATSTSTRPRAPA